MNRPSGNQWWSLVGGVISGFVTGAVLTRFPDIGLPTVLALGVVGGAVIGLAIRLIRRMVS